MKGWARALSAGLGVALLCGCGSSYSNNRTATPPAGHDVGPQAVGTSVPGSWYGPAGSILFYRSGTRPAGAAVPSFGAGSTIEYAAHLRGRGSGRLRLVLVVLKKEAAQPAASIDLAVRRPTVGRLAGEVPGSPFAVSGQVPGRSKLYRLTLQSGGRALATGRFRLR